MMRPLDLSHVRLRMQSVRRQWRRARAEVARAGEALGYAAPSREPVIDMGRKSLLRLVVRLALQVAAVVLALLATIGVTTVLLQLAALWLVLSRGLGIRLTPAVGGT